ncbi:hypothetical protein THF5H11_20122 [Vibrio jasicida]|nr:hypothetical protein THF5H11_20122 [Vibrio jasicida]
MVKLFMSNLCNVTTQTFYRTLKFSQTLLRVRNVLLQNIQN